MAARDSPSQLASIANVRVSSDALAFFTVGIRRNNYFDVFFVKCQNGAKKGFCPVILGRVGLAATPAMQLVRQYLRGLAAVADGK